MQYTMTWRNKWLTSNAETIRDMAQALEQAAGELRQMEKDGVTLDPARGPDDYALLVTADKGIAETYCFEEEPDETEEE
jgi:hypothetical protein